MQKYVDEDVIEQFADELQLVRKGSGTVAVEQDGDDGGDEEEEEEDVDLDIQL